MLSVEVTRLLPHHTLVEAGIPEVGDIPVMVSSTINQGLIRLKPGDFSPGFFIIEASSGLLIKRTLFKIIY